MATKMIGTARRARKVDPNGNIYYDRGVSDIIFDPVRGVSVKQDIDELRAMMLTAMKYIAANPKGLDGKSAYEIALDHGYEGSEAEWVASLKGQPGEDGLSAYEIACRYGGFTGTRSEWLASLQGEKGDKGDSVYDIAVRNGYEGTEQEWYESTLGEPLTEPEVVSIYNTVINSQEGGR